MEELLIKVKNEKESSFLKDLLKKIKIQFETISDKSPSAEEIKRSVLDAQLAYKNGDTDQFTSIESKNIWNGLPACFL